MISQPDRRSGRGHKLKPTPVKELAQQAGVSVYQPESIKTAEFLALLAEKIEKDLATKKYSRITIVFANLAIKIYRDYEKSMKKDKYIDYQDMINVATDLLRKKKELSQEELARKTDLKLSNLAKLEGGFNSNPTLVTLVALAKVLTDGSIDELLNIKSKGDRGAKKKITSKNV